jgi:hypothetical protein
MLADHGADIAQGLQTYDKMTFDQLYQGYKGILTKTKILIPLLYEKGREEGKSVEDIRSKIAELGVEYKTMMTYTPDWAKRKQLHGPRTKRVNKTLTQNQVRLVVDEEPIIPPRPEAIVEVETEEDKRKFQEQIDALGSEPIPIRSQIIEVVFDPAPIDRDRTQVFIIEIDLVTKKVKEYKTVGRRSVR